MLRQTFALANLNDAQTRKISVSGGKRSVDNRNAFTSSGDKLLTRPNNLARVPASLDFAERRQPEFSTAVHAAVIEIESETANFQRFAAAFVLSGVDSGV